ncbi:MAG: hypothetical protein ACLFMV_05845 [Spirochaetaceae bacterium]
MATVLSMDRVLLKQRDRYSVEIKARYLLEETRRARHTYGLRVYFFLPQPFRISRATYDSQSFFRQLKLYLRFNTPVFSIEELLEPLSDGSPLIRVEKLLHRHVHDGESLEKPAFVYESKLLGTVFKSILRDFLQRARRKIVQERPSKDTVDSLEGEVKAAHSVAQRFHRVAEQIESGNKRQIEAPQTAQEEDPGFREHVRMIDEHMSLLLEKYLATILTFCDAQKQDDLYGRIVKVLLKEERYREGRGYPSRPSSITQQRQFEEYVYREKMLKKYASEVLFFDVDRRDTAKRGEHIAYAVAAGIAMALATSIAFFGQTRFGNVSTSLFAVLVAGYILKDRVKDIFRDMLKRRLGPHLNDRVSRIREHRRRKRLATVSERAYYVEEAKLEEDIRGLRDRGYFEKTLFAEDEERILLYAKKLSINRRNLTAVHSRVNGVADINMVDLTPFLRHLSAQYGFVPTIESKKRVRLHRVKRIYHLNLVIAHDGPRGTVAGRFRLVVDANGIKRIEPVTGGSYLSNEGLRLVPTAASEPGDEAEEEY